MDWLRANLPWLCALWCLGGVLVMIAFARRPRPIVVPPFVTEGKGEEHLLSVGDVKTDFGTPPEKWGVLRCERAWTWRPTEFFIPNFDELAESLREANRKVARTRDFRAGADNGMGC